MKRNEGKFISVFAGWCFEILAIWIKSFWYESVRLMPFVWVKVRTFDIKSDKLVFLDMVIINIDILFENNCIGVGDGVLQSQGFVDNLLEEFHSLCSLRVWGEDM